VQYQCTCILTLCVLLSPRTGQEVDITRHRPRLHNSWRQIRYVSRCRDPYWITCLNITWEEDCSITFWCIWIVILIMNTMFLGAWELCLHFCSFVSLELNKYCEPALLLVCGDSRSHTKTSGSEKILMLQHWIKASFLCRLISTLPKI